MERPGYQPPEFAQAKRDEVLKRLEASVESIQDSEDFRQYLDVQSRFHTYSWKNTMLILAQKPEATRVAGLRAWNSMGRFVNKGEHGLDILAPIFPKGVPKQDQERTAPAGFIAVKTFDLSQTNGRDLPEFDVPVLEGDEGGVLMGAFVSHALEEGLQVELDDQMNEHQLGGYIPSQNKIRVREHLPDGTPVSQLQRTKTMAHEMAHHLGGHGKPRKNAEGELLPARSRDEEEAIAEACAYVSLQHFGLDSGARSFPYIATWAKNKNVLKGVMGEIQRVSAKLIGGAERQLEEEHPHSEPEIADEPQYRPSLLWPR